MVVTVTMTRPAAGAVQVHHSDLPPASPAWLGSPASLVAVAELAVAEALLPVRVKRLAKSSFSGGSMSCREKLSDAPFSPSTAKR